MAKRAASIQGTPAVRAVVPDVVERQKIHVAETTFLRAAGIGVERADDGEGWKITCIVNPFKVVILEISEEQKNGIVKEMTGGLEIVQSLGSLG